MTQLLKKRFAELEAQASQVESTRRMQPGMNDKPTERVDAEALLAWGVKTKNLLASACGTASEHYTAFVAAEKYSTFAGNTVNFGRARAVFLAAKEDFEGGYLNKVKNLIQAEVFESELDQARELLASGYHLAAAVVAGVVLETNIRDLCMCSSMPIGKLDKMNADLAKAGRYNALVQKRITALAAIRNSAAHGDIAAFKREDVLPMIDEVERLVAGWLS